MPVFNSMGPWVVVSMSSMRTYVEFGSPTMQPASFREAPPVPRAPPVLPAPPEAVESGQPASLVWPELVVQADTPERKAMPTTEQPKIKFRLRIAALLFVLQKLVYQKSELRDKRRNTPVLPGGSWHRGGAALRSITGC